MGFPQHHRDMSPLGDNPLGTRDLCSRVTFLFKPCPPSWPVKWLMSCKLILRAAKDRPYLKGFGTFQVFNKYLLDEY